MNPIVCKTTYISSNTTTHIQTGSVAINIHTIACPIATTGTVTFRDTGTPTTYFVLPIGSIGTFILDIVCSNGLDVVTSASDKVIITTWQ